MGSTWIEIPVPRDTRLPARGLCDVTLPAPVECPLSRRPDAEISRAAVVAGNPMTFGTVAVMPCAPLGCEAVGEEHAVRSIPTKKVATPNQPRLTTVSLTFKNCLRREPQPPVPDHRRGRRERRRLPREGRESRPPCTQLLQTSVLKILKPHVSFYLRRGKLSCLVPPPSSVASGLNRSTESERRCSSLSPRNMQIRLPSTRCP